MTARALADRLKEIHYRAAFVEEVVFAQAERLNKDENAWLFTELAWCGFHHVCMDLEAQLANACAQAEKLVAA